MERIDKIIGDRVFNEALLRTEKCEAGRIYCCHGFEHLMDTARIGYIIILENKLDITKEMIYAAALLHDSGRYRQYENGERHNIAGAETAAVILRRCGYNEEEISYITDAIREHGKVKDNPKTLGEVLALADKLSRMCMRCKAVDTCKWARNELNTNIIF